MLFRSNGVALVGVSPVIDGLDKSVIDAYRSSVKFIRQICPRAGWGDARNLLSLIGHSLNGQVSSKTSESTSLIFFKEQDLAGLFRATGNVSYEVMETVFP